MDKNTFTGLFLILVILVGSFFLMKPSADEIKKEQQKQHQDSLKRAGVKPAPAAAKADTANKAPVVDSAALKGPFGAATAGNENLVTLENKDIRVKLSTRGGRVYSVELKEIKTFDKKPLLLFDGTNNHFGFKFNVGDKPFDTNNLYFTQATPDVKVTGTDSSAVTLRLSYSPTQYIDYIYSLGAAGYKLGFTVKTTGLDNVIGTGNAININWAASLRKQEKDMAQERQYSSVYYKNLDDDVDNLNATKDDSKQVADQKLQWVSFKQHFFSNVLIAKQGFEKASMAVSTDVNSQTDIKQMRADLTLLRDANGTYPMEFYFGPNRFSTLKKQGYSLEKQIDLGWGPLKFINRFAVIPVFNFLQQFGWNMGLIILVLTILLKLVLSPLTYKSYLSMAKMRVLKPEMDEIKTKVGEENPTLLQQEYMKLYRQAGVNPLGGCFMYSRCSGGR